VYEEQVAGEMKIFTGKCASRELQLNTIVCQSAGLDRLVEPHLRYRDLEWSRAGNG
jgi:hypothetical protein